MPSKEYPWKEYHVRFTNLWQKKDDWNYVCKYIKKSSFNTWMGKKFYISINLKSSANIINIGIDLV